MNKYEQLIEHIINDNEQAAKELFHQIVVEKSRDIYESLMDEEQGVGQAQGFVQDITQQDNAASDQGLGEDDEEAGKIELDGDDDDEFGDEETFGGGAMDNMGNEHSEHGNIKSKIDELSAQLEELKDMLGGDDDKFVDEETFGGADMDNMGNEHSEHGNIESKIDELSAQLEELKAMLGGEEEPAMDNMGGEEPAMDSDFDSDDMDSKDDGFGKSEEIAVEGKKGKNPFAKSGSGKSGSGKSIAGKSGSGMKESYKKTDVEIMKEYVDKIGEIYKGDQNSPSGKMAGTGDKSEQQGEKNIKSVVRGQGPKFDGETASNIVNGGAEQAPDNKPIPEPKNEYAKKRGELPGAGSFQNVPGGNAGKTGFKTKESAKTAEGSTTDGSVPVNKKSEIGGKVR
jgi:hypothetical protein